MTIPTPKADQNRALREAKFAREQERQREEKRARRVVVLEEGEKLDGTLMQTVRMPSGEEVIPPVPSGSRPSRSSQAKPAEPNNLDLCRGAAEAHSVGILIDSGEYPR